MTILCELTHINAKQNYLAALGTKNEKYIPTIFGHQLYVFLYEYLSKNNNKVNFIEIIKPDDDRLEKLFYEEIKSYSTDIEDYTRAWEIEHWFPEENQLENTNLVIRITNMIREIKFVDTQTLKDKEYLCYLPLCADKLNYLLISEKNNFKIITNTELAKIYPGKLVNFDRVQYKEIYHNLLELKKNYQTIFDENIGEAKYYKAPKYLDNFEGGYFEEIKKVQYNSNDKELYFFGSEPHTAREGIDYLLGSNNYREYNLLYALEKVPVEDRAFVFLNFHYFFGQNKQNDLAAILQKSKLKNHKVIQGDNVQLISFFEKFRRVSVPEESEIKNTISGIFVSFLIKKNKYRDRDWTLYPFVKHRLLNNLLDNSASPKALSMAIDNFSDITKSDLLENISFWCLFFNEYSRALSEINKNKVKAPLKIKDKWIIEITDKKYRVLYPKEDTGPQKYTKFVTYLLLLIKYAEIKKQPLPVDVLRKSILKYDNEKVPDEIDLETARVAISKIFNKAIKDHEWFKIFYESYIKYENNEYRVDLSLLDLTIVGFELNSNFFDKLH